MRRFLFTISALATLLATAPVNAQSAGSVVREIRVPVAETMQGNGVSLQQAVEQVRRQCKGRIVDAKTRTNGNRETHEIKCLTQDGKVRTFRIPGKRHG